MIDKVNHYVKEVGGKKIHVLEFPDLDMINSSDPEIQETIIRYGLAVGVPGAYLNFTESVELVARGGAI